MSAADSDDDEDSDAHETYNEISDDSHGMNIPEKRIKCTMNSLQNTSKEFRIGACHESEESTEEFVDDNSSS
eukprot:14172807-Ditylum_brightwellii.AAC.1